MSSFKLEKGGSAWQQVRGAGAFLAIVGAVVAILIMPITGYVMVVAGLIFFLASFAASE